MSKIYVARFDCAYKTAPFGVYTGFYKALDIAFQTTQFQPGNDGIEILSYTPNVETELTASYGRNVPMDPRIAHIGFPHTCNNDTHRTIVINVEFVQEECAKDGIAPTVAISSVSKEWGFTITKMKAGDKITSYELTKRLQL